MGQHPTDDLEAPPPALRGIAAEALRRSREMLAALPSEDVQAVYMLPRWTVPTELEGSAYRSARWAVATMHGSEHRGKAPPVARLDELTDAERTHLHGLVVAQAHVTHKALDLDLPPHGEGWPTVPTLPEEGGMLAWTYRLLKHLEAYLDKCTDAPEADRTWMREWLANFREEEVSAWGDGTALACWHIRAGELDRGPRWLNMVALAVWVLEVAPRVAHARRPPAVTLRTLSAIQDALSYRGKVEVLEAGQAPPSTRIGTWVEASAAVDSAALTRIQRGTGLLGSVLAPKMLTLLVNRIQRRLDASGTLVLSGRDDLNVWEALAAELGVREEKRIRQEVRPLFEALASLHYRTDRGLEVGGLWTWAYENDQGGRGKAGTLHISPNPALIGKVGEHGSDRVDRFLVPLPELPGWCAPMLGGPRNHGGIARLWLWTLCRLRAHADDIERGNGVLIDDWEAAAVEVGLSNPGPLLVQHGLIGRWTRDGDDGPAVLEEVAPKRYHLAPHLAAERAMLQEAGRRTIQGSKGGKASSARRAHPTMRRGKKPPGQ